MFPNGGESSYWHRRASGDWPRYVLDEVIPRAVRRLGADSSRVAIGGISMGGYGAYNIARLRPRRFCAVGGHSAALWRSDPFRPGGQAFADALDVALRLRPGEHEGDYWRANYRAYLRFYAAALAACRPA